MRAAAPAFWPLVPLLTLALTAGASAQSVGGLVVDHATGRALNGVRVALYGAGDVLADETVTDDLGRFDLVAPARGTWQLTAELIGYATVSEPVQTRDSERIELEIRMPVEAVQLDEPIVVTSRSFRTSADVQAFYDRRERGAMSGLGEFISRADIDRLRPSEPTDLLRTVGGLHAVRGRNGGGTLLRMGSCIPAIFVDGAQINRFDLRDSVDDFVSAGAIEGVEIYRGAHGQVGRFHDPRGCGLILVWTRRGVLEEGDDEGTDWSKPLLALGILLTYFLFD